MVDWSRDASPDGVSGGLLRGDRGGVFERGRLSEAEYVRQFCAAVETMNDANGPDPGEIDLARLAGSQKQFYVALNALNPPKSAEPWHEAWLGILEWAFDRWENDPASLPDGEDPFSRFFGGWEPQGPVPTFEAEARDRLNALAGSEPGCGPHSFGVVNRMANEAASAAG